jgi:hypothetical protein
MTTTEQTLTGLEFSVAQGAGTIPDKIVIDSEQVLIGSGPHCEIRLPPDQAQAEHVLISFRDGGVFAQARAAQPPPLLNGAPFTEAQVEQGSLLRIGVSEITVSMVEIADAAKAGEAGPKEKVNPLTYLLAAIAVPLSLWILLDDTSTAVGASKPEEEPALWEEASPKCNQSAKEQALAVARDKRVIALGRRERSPFDVRDGVLAVPLFYMAADCYRVAGNANQQKEMLAAGERLKTQMEEGYRAHKMRLEHSLDVNNLRTAQTETRILLRMLEGQKGPYVGWLSNLERQLKVMLGKEGKQ